jgi:ABC-type phosphate/phosphonate transport system substrate-binding protein
MDALSRAVLPNSKPAKAVMPFQVGSQVKLRTCPDDERVVQGSRRGKVLVLWRSPHYTGKHKPRALILAQTQQPSGPPSAARLMFNNEGTSRHFAHTYRIYLAASTAIARI